jgi:hypothetical protein
MFQSSMFLLATILLESTSDDGALKLNFVIYALNLKLVLHLREKLIVTCSGHSCNFTGIHA